MSGIGVVVIGRNEGERLRVCLVSAISQLPHSPIVYVDSGSTDGSAALAQSLGVEVIALDLSIPFTAARARNAGFAALVSKASGLEMVQFVDGDCELVEGWCERAVAALRAEADLALVCGRRRERYPHQSIFNQLCDMEWNTPIGEALACGGDAMIRIAALRQVQGYRDSLIAGEEPELCLRLRRGGWRILRLEAEMTLHDANILRFSQWWRRTVRAGHAYAEGAWLYGLAPEHHWLRESLRSWFWGLILPLALCLSLRVSYGWSAGGFLVYPVLAGRIAWQRRSTEPASAASWYALFCVLGKVAEVQGQIQFHCDRLQGQGSQLLEYK
ncbi:MAG: glycosyltransferase [Acaryochloridaceae cyanobacterium SU_2_1]|nr:glycosyltransferase [Acaryochloridaceae cyanobacterium SU_2_1]NJM95211.1 glycosyltransferase [Acaryochloridaceae cyanobacterium CSU_5_19]